LDASAVAEVTDFLLDRIDAYRPSTTLGNAEKNVTGSAQFATPENRRDNGVKLGAR
jgi:hypothetical protein